MLTKKRLELIKELTVLFEYHDRLLTALENVSQVESQSVLSININKLAIPALQELKVFDHNGDVIDWEQTGFPAELKRMPFRIFPGARLEEPPKFEISMDFELRSDFLINLLTYLYKQVNLRIEHLQKQLSNGD